MQEIKERQAAVQTAGVQTSPAATPVRSELPLPAPPALPLATGPAGEEVARG